MSAFPSAIDLAVRALERALTATLTRRSVASHPIRPLATLLQASAAFSSETVFDLRVDGGARAEATEAWLAAAFAPWPPQLRVPSGISRLGSRLEAGRDGRPTSSFAANPPAPRAP